MLTDDFIEIILKQNSFAPIAILIDKFAPPQSNGNNVHTSITNLPPPRYPGLKMTNP